MRVLIVGCASHIPVGAITGLVNRSTGPGGRIPLNDIITALVAERGAAEIEPDAVPVARTDAEGFFAQPGDAILLRRDAYDEMQKVLRSSISQREMIGRLTELMLNAVNGTQAPDDGTRLTNGRTDGPARSHDGTSFFHGVASATAAAGEAPPEVDSEDFHVPCRDVVDELERSYQEGEVQAVVTVALGSAGNVVVSSSEGTPLTLNLLAQAILVANGTIEAAGEDS